MAGVVGGCEAISPIVEAGDSVIRISENVNESVSFPEVNGIVETINETVSVIVT